MDTSARVMAPAFRGLVVVMIARRRTRRAGIAALAASLVAADVARRARDAIGRPRPGLRAEGGMPSRHAAAGTAITVAVSRRHPAMAAPLWAANAVGLAGRVHTGEHHAADILAGAALGGVVARLVSAIVAPRRGRVARRPRNRYRR